MIRGKKLLVSMLLAVFALTLFIPACFAQEDEILKVKLGTRDLTKDQIDELVKDPEKLIIRSKMDTEYLLSEAEKEMNEASAEHAKELKKPAKGDVSSLASDIYIGTDTDYYLSDTGNKDSSADLISGASSRWSSYYSDDYSWTAGIGSASSWAYNAKTINVKGTGSRTAYIRFRGNYSGWTVPGFTGGTAAALIRVSIYDLTVRSEIGAGTVKSVSDSVNWGSTFEEEPFNKSVLVSLQAGHSYLLRYGVSTSTSNYGPQMCQSDFYNNTYHGIYQDYVTVDWQ
jgi:hypothetical protein